MMRGQFRDVPERVRVRDAIEVTRAAARSLRESQGTIERIEPDHIAMAYEDGFEAGREASLPVMAVWIGAGILIGAAYRWLWDWIVR